MSGNSSSGWNRPSANQPTAKKGGAKPNFGKGILAGLVVCVLALGVLYVMRDSDQHLQRGGYDIPRNVVSKGGEVCPKPRN